MIGMYDDVVLSFSESKAEEVGMARSMTAFGRCSDIVGGKSITVELKSVNNRFFLTAIPVCREHTALSRSG